MAEKAKGIHQLDQLIGEVIPEDYPVRLITEYAGGPHVELNGHNLLHLAGSVHRYVHSCTLTSDGAIDVKQTEKDKNEKTTLPIVSVGSGNGRLEYHIQNMGNIVYPIDPAPESHARYHKVEFLKPVHPKLDTWPLASSLTRHCHLMLIWTTPNTKDGSYDVDAIAQLQPASIFLLYEQFGGAGSSAFHRWLHQQRDYIVKKTETAIMHVNNHLKQTTHWMILERVAKGTAPQIPEPEFDQDFFDSLEAAEKRVKQAEAIMNQCLTQ